MRTTALLAACLSLASIINGISIAMVENIGTVPDGWRMVGVPDPSQRLRFSIAVKQQNRALFEQTLYDVSTPSHPSYGRHLKRDDLKDLVRPTIEATMSIIEWLEESGVRSGSIEDDGDWITFVATVEQAETMMNTKFNYYQSHVRPNVRILRTTHYFVQDGLDQYIDMIQPTTRFPQVQPQSSPIMGTQEIGASRANPNTTACNDNMTPTCLRELYNIKGFRANPAKGGFIGVSGFLDQYARCADLDTFLSEYAPWVQNGTFTYTSLNGSSMEQNSTNSSIEANLDIQYTVSLSYPLRNHFYSTPGRGELVPDLDQPTQSDNLNEPYLEFFTYLLNLPDGQLPQTLTISYGENEQSVPEPYARRVCDMIGQLGLRGVSVIFASGDSGVGSACRTNDGRNATRFMPIFPASCPYVTSVGGTYGVEPERAIAFSSGGFSDLFPRPAYQHAAVSAYLEKLGDRWAGLYDPAGRGFPDLAAQALSFPVVDQGVEVLVGGTSASAPVVAAIIALLNSARLSANKPPLGFLNPWLYSEGYKALTDIVEGGSTGCVLNELGEPETPFVPYASWNATVGWDPVTGFGTPDFGKMLKLAMRREERRPWRRG